MSKKETKPRILIFDCDEDNYATGKNTSLLFKNYLPYAEMTRACEGVFPAQLDFDGYIIGGSSAHVSDAQNIKGKWINHLIDSVRKIDEADKPILGVCFGHQILAHVFGGHVEQGKEEFGLHKINVTKKDKLFANLEEKIYLAEAHSDWVTILPKNAEPIAKNNKGCIQGFCYRMHHGVQFHPEIQLAFLLGMTARKKQHELNYQRYEERTGRIILTNWYNSLKL